MLKKRRVGIKKLVLLATIQITFLFNLTTSDHNLSRRIIIPNQVVSIENNLTPDEVVEEYRIIRLLDRLEQGTFNGNGQEELLDAYNSTLKFLANSEIPWEMKKNILTRINILPILLNQELRTLFIQGLQELDRLEFERQRREALSKIDSMPTQTYALHLPALSLPTSILVQNAFLRTMDRRIYSRYLDIKN